MVAQRRQLGRHRGQVRVALTQERSGVGGQRVAAPLGPRPGRAVVAGRQHQRDAGRPHQLAGDGLPFLPGQTPGRVDVA